MYKILAQNEPAGGGLANSPPYISSLDLKNTNILLQGNSQTITLSSLPQSSIVTSSGSNTILIQPDQASQGTNLPLTPVTVDLPSIGAQSTNEESGVLLCNLDDLSKYAISIVTYHICILGVKI